MFTVDNVEYCVTSLGCGLIFHTISFVSTIEGKFK